MGFQTMRIEVMGADYLRDVNFVTSMDVYVVASIPDLPKATERTSVHKNGGVSPRWDDVLRFIISDSFLNEPDHKIIFEIRANGFLLCDKHVGTVTANLHDLYVDNPGRETRIVDYPVWTRSGIPQGVLTFGYWFGFKSLAQPSKPPAQDKLLLPGSNMKNGSHAEGRGYNHQGNMPNHASLPDPDMPFIPRKISDVDGPYRSDPSYIPRKISDVDGPYLSDPSYIPRNIPDADGASSWGYGASPSWQPYGYLPEPSSRKPMY